MKCCPALSGNLSKIEEITGSLTNQEIITGSLANQEIITGELTVPIDISGTLIIPTQVGDEYEEYIGDIVNIIPSFEPQVFNTKEKVLMEDVTISEIQIYETSNVFGGTTLVI